MIQRHDFLIAIDSDGTAFDTMEIKHKECFIPNIIKHWHLQPVHRHARQAAEFVNLYSQWRGLNRFPALIKVFDLLAEWPDLQNRREFIPRADALRRWIEHETRLCNAALRLAADESGDQELLQAWHWSEEVNRTVEAIINHVPPFTQVKASLEKISSWADVIVCSVTAGKELAREWRTYGLDQHIALLAGQEMGSKSEILSQAAAGRYPSDHILMIGDAPVDEKASRAVQAHFFPIMPGDEENSWQLFYQQAADRFYHGEYHATYESELLHKFNQLLPAIPPWLIS